MILIGATGVILIVAGAFRLLMGIAIIRRRDPLPYRSHVLNQRLIRQRGHRVITSVGMIVLGLTLLAML